MCRPIPIFILGLSRAGVVIKTPFCLRRSRRGKFSAYLWGQLSQVQPVPQLQEPELEHPQLPILMNLLGLQLVWWFG